ncbi:hypothetical protein E2C01_030784 [Portunus trituberculatus]|uniref:Uncharacterized protein n=1 Tax=Portunus trituberculatus TaxID=210409 RepID=A0A5B7ERY0_PORTR|nr:hypothetical protein [Portunus trituberculatus]
MQAMPSNTGEVNQHLVMGVNDEYSCPTRSQLCNNTFVNSELLGVDVGILLRVPPISMPTARKPLPRVRKPNLHRLSVAGQDSNPYA